MDPYFLLAGVTVLTVFVALAMRVAGWSLGHALKTFLPPVAACMAGALLAALLPLDQRLPVIVGIWLALIAVSIVREHRSKATRP